MEELTFEPDFIVYGRAYPKGSKTVLPNGRMMDAAPSRCADDDERKRRNRERNAWPKLLEARARELKLWIAHTSYGGRPAMKLSAVFFLPHPKTGAQRFNHVAKPDLDKLLRMVCDALTAAEVWHDDSQVASFDGSSKRYAKKGAPVGSAEGPRVEITVRAVTFEP